MCTEQDNLTIIERLEQYGHDALSACEHGAAWLVGKIAAAEQSLHNLEASSPLVAEAIAAGAASLRARGIPVDAIEATGEEILSLAKQLASSLSSPPPAPPVATVTDQVQQPGAV